MTKTLCIFAAVVTIAACSTKTSNEASTTDSTQTDATGDSLYTVSQTGQGVEEMNVEETATDGESTELEKMYAAKSEEIKANTDNLYEATLTVNGYESSTSVLFYFSKSGSLLYASEDWSMESQSGTVEYFADDDGLVLSLSATSYDDEGGTVNQKTLWHKTLGGTIFSENPDGSVTSKPTESNYGTSEESEFGAKANAIHEILKTGEVTDNGTTIEVKLVEEVNYGETFEEVTTLTLPKALYTLLTKS